jgi:transposase
MTVYTGIDFHKRTSTICFMQEDGTHKIEKILSSNLINHLIDRKDLSIAIEASCGVNHVVELLKARNIEVKIINSNKFRGIGIGGKKTDERDAIALATGLKTGFIPTVYHKSLGARRLKSLLRVREQYVQTRVSATNHIRGILREYGITINVGAEEFETGIGEALERLDYPLLQEKLRDLVYEERRLKAKEKEIDNNIETLLASDVHFKNLKTIPGVGTMTAAAMLAIGDEFSRFPNAKAFASYLGLVPSESSSGDKIRRGAITKAGQEILRRYLIHGARSVLRYTNENSKEPIRVWAFKIKGKRGMNKATVALAHRLAKICFCVIKNEREYLREIKIGN